MKSLVQLDCVYVHSEGVVSRDIETQIVIIPLVSGIRDIDDEMYTLNETGRAIWDRVDGRRRLRDIITELSAVFQAEEGEIEADVLGLVQELVRRKMIIDVERV